MSLVTEDIEMSPTVLGPDSVEKRKYQMLKIFEKCYVQMA